MVVTSSLVKDIVDKLSADERASFKLLSYIDQVYPYQKSDYVKVLNKYFDGVIAFTPYWESVVKGMGLRDTMPTYFFPHGFDHKLYYPIPKKLARLHNELPFDDFIVLNLNRNQPRKRWDHTLMAFADVVERHQKLKKNHPDEVFRQIKLLIGTSIQGSCDIFEVFAIETKKRGIPFEIAKTYIATTANPQQLSDRDINILYNACDIGINTCEGEGFGLCQFEHLGVGCPQVVSKIGGFCEYINDENSTAVEPKWSYYLDNTRGGIGGYAEVSDPKDFADAIWSYYMNPENVTKHGLHGRKEIVQNYGWDTMVDILYKIIVDCC
jgi:glycosyltransferase involved in cell wall biosynthesis